MSASDLEPKSCLKYIWDDLNATHSSSRGGTYPVDWANLCAAYLATGATLGVMALILVLFLMMLCIPWSKCRAGRRRTENARALQDDDPFGLEAFNGGYPLTLVDLFPPSMLPKLPNYQECVQDGGPPPPVSDDSASLAVPPPNPFRNERGRTITSVELVNGAIAVEFPRDEYSDTLEDPDNFPSTPPPSYSTLTSARSSLRRFFRRGSTLTQRSEPHTFANSPVTRNSAQSSTRQALPNETTRTQSCERNTHEAPPSK
ncbi:hypothetical protein X801_04948 [Opisthorchis viverrini]|uniref:Uncharacterized protein n=1 Tax=Opisthorchis viverrini TaxID=6198 RepID=A0A1S8WXV0_OPIVI|nr:hypothetical protein X801_04948 [Opisthorchis viverrini]